MSDKFLNTGGSGNANLSNGTINAYLAGLTIANLRASMPLKTNSVNTLVSTKLDITDINSLESRLAAASRAGYELQLVSTDELNDIDYKSDYDKTTWSNTSLNTHNFYNYYATPHKPTLRTPFVPLDNRGTNVSNESELDLAISEQKDNIFISGDFSITSGKFIVHSCKISGDPILKPTITAVGISTSLFNVSADNVFFENLILVNADTGSNCNCIYFGFNIEAKNNAVHNCVLRTNEFAINSDHHQIQIYNNSFEFTGIADSHRYIYLGRCNGEVLIYENTFTSNGSATPNSACMLINSSWGSSAYDGGHLVIYKNSSVGVIQRMAIMETEPVNFKLSLLENTINTNTDFFILYGGTMLTGFTEITAYKNTVTLMPTSLGFKGLVGWDGPASAITYCPIVRGSLNNLPSNLRVDYSSIPNLGNILCYKNTSFSTSLTVPLNPSLVAFGEISQEGITGPVSSVDNSIVFFDGTTGKILKENTNFKFITGATYGDQLKVPDIETDDHFSINEELTTMDTAITTNTTNNTGSVTIHSDVSNAGSGAIITVSERTAITTNTTNNTGSVTVHSDVSSAGSGAIITAGERTAIGTNTTKTQNITASPSVTTFTGTISSSNVKATNVIAIGTSAGVSQAGEAIAIGNNAGSTQGAHAIGIGRYAGWGNQRLNAVGVGNTAGFSNQLEGAVAVGYFAGGYSQSEKSVAIGYEAGRQSLGANSIAIGNLACNLSQAANSINLNASGVAVNPATTGTFINPMRNQTASDSVFYNSTTGELSYNTLDLSGITGSVTVHSDVSSAGSGAIITASERTAITTNTTATQNITASSGSTAFTGTISSDNVKATSQVAIGASAGTTSQGNFSVAVGSLAGNTQGAYCVAIGEQAGRNTQGQGSIAIGSICGKDSQGLSCISIGSAAAQNNQKNGAIAIGNQAGRYTQGVNSVALGGFAGLTNQSDNSIVINATGVTLDATTNGSTFIKPLRNQTATDFVFYNSTTGELSHNTLDLSGISGSVTVHSDVSNAGSGAIITTAERTAISTNTTKTQNITASPSVTTFTGTISSSNVKATTQVAIGNNSGTTSQGTFTVAIGNNAGTTSQLTEAIAIGPYAGNSNQGRYTVGIGGLAGAINQQDNGVAIGTQAGRNTQGLDGVAVGFKSGFTNQQANSVAIGKNSGNLTQGTNSVAVGAGSGQTTQGAYCVALGEQAGYSLQGQGSIAIGSISGKEGQGLSCVSIGSASAQSNQKNGAVAIGNQAGRYTQGLNSVAIGAFAGQTNQFDNSIVINASGAVFNGTRANAFFVNPINFIASGQSGALEENAMRPLRWNGSDGEIHTPASGWTESFYYQVSNSVDTRPFHNDYYASMSWDETGNRLLFTMKVAPASDGMRSTAYLFGGSSTNTFITTVNTEYSLYPAGVSAGNRLEVIVAPENSINTPTYRITVYNTGESTKNVIIVDRTRREFVF